MHIIKVSQALTPPLGFGLVEWKRTLSWSNTGLQRDKHTLVHTKQRQGAWKTHTQAGSGGTLTETAALWPLHTLQCSRGSTCDPLTKSQRSSPANTLYPLSFDVCRDAPLNRLLIFIHMFLLKVCAALRLRDKEFKGFLYTFVYVWVSEWAFSRRPWTW